MRTTKSGCLPRARPTRSGACGSRSRPSPRTTAGSPMKGLWPLCHVVDVRPKFRTEDWAGLPGRQRALRRPPSTRRLARPTRPFSSRTITSRWSRRRSGRCGPTRGQRSSGTFRGRTRIVCASARGGGEIVAGLLANDLIAFQLERDRRNFLMAAEEELGAEIEAEASRVRFGGRTRRPWSQCRSASITIASRAFAADPSLVDEQQRLRELLDLRADIIGLGVDRLDYTKGIPERLDALDVLFTRRPELRGRLTFVQIGVPSRSDLESYSRDRSRDRSARRRDQRAARRCRAAAAGCLSQGGARRCPASSRSTASRTSASSARCTTA